jgi:outer membrane protein assembly factor BamB
MLAQPGTKVWQFVTDSRVLSSPAVGSDGAIFFGTLDRKVYALNPNGTKRWEFLTGGAIVSSPALGADETVYIGARDRKLYAISSTGQKKWEFLAGGEINSSPAVAPNGALYVGSADFKVYALRPDGARQWEFATGHEVFAGPVLAVDGTVYVASRDGKLYALTPTGAKRWEFATRGPIDATPALGLDGVVYVASRDDHLYALTPIGDKLWDFAAGSSLYASPAVGADGTIYLAAGGKRLFAVTPAGAKKWETPLDDVVLYASPCLAADGTICVSLSDGRLRAFGADGAAKWTFQAGARNDYSSPVIGPNGVLYIGSHDGQLYAVNGGSGPASGLWPMFRRDARHTGSGFVERDLPGAYSPGARMRLKLRATPPPGVTSYAVEDSPPPNWQVSQISDSGFFDLTNRRVRFGPFFDAQARELTYVVTPPAGEAGVKQFAGTSWTFEGAKRLVGGDHGLPMLPLHPADNGAADGWLTLGEMTAYGAAWKKGAPWPAGPSPVPLAHLTRAIKLWQASETYRFDTNFATAPQWWTAAPTNHLTGATPPPSFPPTAGAASGTAESTMPKVYRPGEPLTVAIKVTPGSGVVVYAVEEQPPEGWLVSAVTGGGALDEPRRKLKWGPFFDDVARTFTYQVTPPPGAAEPADFIGVAAFDAQVASVSGRRRAFPDSPASAPRLSAATFSPELGLRLALTGLSGESYAIQASTNLVDWEAVGVVTYPGKTVDFLDPAATNHPVRFYRAVWP